MGQPLNLCGAPFAGLQLCKARSLCCPQTYSDKGGLAWRCWHPVRRLLGLEQISFLKVANDQNETHPEQSRRGRQLTLGRRDPQGHRDRCRPPGGERDPPRWAREPEQQLQNKTQTLTNTHTRPWTKVTTPQTPKWKQSCLNRLLLKMWGV